MKLTIISTPKKFVKPWTWIQYNAIRSWLFLVPKPDVIIIGDEEFEPGIAEFCKKFELKQVKGVKRSQENTPLLKSMISLGEENSTSNIIMLANLDMMFRQSLINGIDIIAKKFDKFLAVGQRYDLLTGIGPNPSWSRPDQIDKEIDFDSNWEERVHKIAPGRMTSDCAIDYFVFTKGLWPKIPPFVIGRRAWDNWLLHGALKAGAPLVDMTHDVEAYHQHHDYSHHPKGDAGVWSGVDAQNNCKIWDEEIRTGTVKGGTIRTATWTLIGGEIKEGYIPNNKV